MRKVQLVDKIDGFYLPELEEENKFFQLKKLNSKAKLPARLFGFTFGALGVIILVAGLCLMMKIIGGEISALMPIGIVVVLLGIAMTSIAHPVYKKLLAKGKKKYGQQIIEKSNEILNEGV